MTTFLLGVSIYTKNLSKWCEATDLQENEAESDANSSRSMRIVYSRAFAICLQLRSQQDVRFR